MTHTTRTDANAGHLRGTDKKRNATKQDTSPRSTSDDERTAKRTYRTQRRIRQTVLTQLVEAEITPAELAGQIGMSLSQLAHWAARPENARALEHLAWLADLRAQMLVSRYRANAAMQLIAIASTDKPGELARKACVDLLKAELGVFAADGQQRHAQPDEQLQAPQFTPPSAGQILSTLERIGRSKPEGA